MSESLKGLFWIGLLTFLLTLLIGLTGIVESEPTILKQLFNSDLLIVSLGFVFTDFFILAMISHPSRSEVVFVIFLGGLVSALYFWYFPLKNNQPIANYIYPSVIGFGIGLASLAVLINRAMRSQNNVRRSETYNLLGFGGLMVLYVLYAEPFLNLTISLHPATYDAHTLLFDQALGFQLSLLFAKFLANNPVLSGVIESVYGLLPFGFTLLFGYYISNNKKQQIYIPYFWILSAAVVLIAYHLLPVSGPKYFFGIENFPDKIPDIGAIEVAPYFTKPAPRNAVPSMHFGWAFAMWIFAYLSRSRILEWFFGIFAVLTAIATLGTGEHYLVDLVVSLPFVLMIISFLSFGIKNHPIRNYSLLSGIAGYIIWLILLRYGMEFIHALPILSWISILLTLALFIPLYIKLLATLRDYQQKTPTLSSKNITHNKRDRKILRYAVIMFSLSGFAGLLYEVIFSKALALTFGSNAIATQTVLAIYMGGMAFGAWLGGRISTSRKFTPITVYLACELGIGIYGLSATSIFQFIQSIYVSIGSGLPPDADILVVFRIALGAISLAIPTILMGITLPILVKVLSSKNRGIGDSVGLLYAVNTVGAAIGALIGGYVILPTFGVNRSTLLAVVINFIVTLIAIELRKQNDNADKDLIASASTPKNIFTTTPDDLRLGKFAVILLFIGGFITLAIEVNYIHLLAVVAGNSTYAFSLMLFTFLFGLAFGSETGRHLLKLDYSLINKLILTEFFFALSILFGISMWGELSDYFGTFTNYQYTKSFGAREFVRGAACFIAMFPPAFIIGVIYPMAMEAVARANPDRPVSAVGSAVALNTVGNIFGVLLASFILLPKVGPILSSYLFTTLITIITLCLLYIGRKSIPWYYWTTLPIILFFAYQQPTDLDYTKIASGTNVYFLPQPHGEVIDHAASIDGGLTSVSMMRLEGQQPIKTLLTNGKFQGNDAVGGEMVAQIGFGLTPMLHTKHRGSALVIGYGTGVTSRTIFESGFKTLDIAELSKDLFQMSDRHFSKVNNHVREKQGVKSYVTDGRNFLLLQKKSYDLVSIELSSIWFAGAASLYNTEFYQLVSDHLTEEGVLQQWVQLHHLTPIDITYIIGSARAAFKYIWLYHIGNQGIIVASNSPAAYPTFDKLEVLNETASLGPIRDIFGKPLETIRDSLLLNPKGIDTMLNGLGLPKEYWVSTDDNLFLEYSTPKGNALDDTLSRTENLMFLSNFDKANHQSILE